MVELPEADDDGVEVVIAGKDVRAIIDMRAGVGEQLVPLDGEHAIREPSFLFWFQSIQTDQDLPPDKRVDVMSLSADQVQSMIYACERLLTEAVEAKLISADYVGEGPSIHLETVDAEGKPTSANSLDADHWQWSCDTCDPDGPAGGAPTRAQALEAAQRHGNDQHGGTFRLSVNLS